MNAVIYALLYILCMIPTYILPFLGSNSGAANMVIIAAKGAPSSWLLMHVAALVVMFILALARGSKTGRGWIVIFPILAAIFDFVPVLSWIPLVPTIMHLLAIIIGVIGASKPVQVIIQQAAPTAVPPTAGADAQAE